MEFAHRLVSTRAGTFALALLAAIAAGAAVVVYVQHYRSSTSASGTPATVLVAKHEIPKGMSVSSAVSLGYFEPETLRTDQLTQGALADPAAIRDQVASRDILAGEQITTSEFGTSVSGLATKLDGTQRAVAVTLDQAPSVASQIQVGDHVDVLVGFTMQSLATGLGQPVVKTLLQDVPVLSVTHPSGSAGANSSSNVVLRVTTQEAAKLTYAAVNGKVWLVLRPRVGAPTVKPSLVTLNSLLLGTKPIVQAGR